MHFPIQSVEESLEKAERIKSEISENIKGEVKK
jgi:hypothetical protein